MKDRRFSSEIEDKGSIKNTIVVIIVIGILVVAGFARIALILADFFGKEKADAYLI